MASRRTAVLVLIAAVFALEMLAGVLLVAVPGMEIPVVVVASLPLLVLAAYFLPEPALVAFLFAGTFTLGTAVPIDVGILLGGVVFVVVLMRVRTEGMQRVPPESWLFVALLGLLIVGLAYSKAPAYGIPKITRFASLGALALFSPLVLLRDARSVRRFFYSIILVGVTLSIDAIVVGVLTGNAGRLVAFGGGPITLARAAALALGGCLVFAGWERRSLVWGLPVGFVCLWALAGSGSRGPGLALLSALFALGAVSLLRLRVSRPVMVAVVVGLVILGSGVWQVAGTVATSRYALFLSGDPGTSGAARLRATAEAEQLIFRYPFTGTGSGSFYAYEPWMRYPHNMLLEVGSENGLVALSLLLAVLIGAAWRAMRGVLDAPGLLTNLLFVSLAVAWANSLVSGDLNDNMMLCALIGLALSGVVTRGGRADATPGAVSGDAGEAGVVAAGACQDLG